MSYVRARSYIALARASCAYRYRSPHNCKSIRHLRQLPCAPISIDRLAIAQLQPELQRIGDAQPLQG